MLQRDSQHTHSSFAYYEEICKLSIRTQTVGPGGYLAAVEPEKLLALQAVVECGGVPESDVDIEITLQVEANTGGHEHHDPMRPNGVLRLAGISDSDTAVLTGTTEESGLDLQFEAPKLAGDHVIKVRCLDRDCVTGDPQKIWVGRTGFQQLPSSAYYSLIPNRDQEHPSNHYMTPDAAAKVAQIATRYHNLFADDPVIHLNDASLIRGGMFDFSYSTRQQYWRPPHQTHHDGRRIDIRANSLSSAIPSSNFEDFKRIARRVGCVTEIHSPGASSQHFHLYCR